MKSLTRIQAEAPSAFSDVLGLIRQSRQRALQAANTELVELYGRIGEYLSQKAAQEAWGEGTVKQLAAWLKQREPGLRGFSASNLWRMKQFYEICIADKKLAPLVRALPWSHNLLVLSKCKTNEERAFYLDLAAKERLNKRELERQLQSALFERMLTGKPKLSTVLREIHPASERIFKDRYLVGFLNLPESHNEQDLHRGLLAHLKDFLLELGREFCFIGSEYRVQVGKRDFFVDLLFFHRGLQALVAFELKICAFEERICKWLALSDAGAKSVERSGPGFWALFAQKLDRKACHLYSTPKPRPFSPRGVAPLHGRFSHKALDRDHRLPHEAPSIGVLLCKTQDEDVVEYALSRSLSPAMVAEYQTRLPDKAVLQAKLEEFYEMTVGEMDE